MALTTDFEPLALTQLALTTDVKLEHLKLSWVLFPANFGSNNFSASMKITNPHWQ